MARLEVGSSRGITATDGPEAHAPVLVEASKGGKWLVSQGKA
jgi:hypothetical protein